ncbi:hypothetical protein [Selenomonas ruminantium]|nr:hypothetical protein [Selenomonas ruminantium]
MIGKIGHDFLAKGLEYGCKREVYHQVLQEERWLDAEMNAGDG